MKPGDIVSNKLGLYEVYECRDGLRLSSIDLIKFQDPEGEVIGHLEEDERLWWKNNDFDLRQRIAERFKGVWEEYANT